MGYNGSRTWVDLRRPVWGGPRSTLRSDRPRWAFVAAQWQSANRSLREHGDDSDEHRCQANLPPQAPGARARIGLGVMTWHAASGSEGSGDSRTRPAVQ